MDGNASILIRSSRTVGGSHGFYNFLPFIIEIFFKPKNEYASHLCSGSLIAYDWVLTAGHCVYRESSAMYILGAGINDNTDYETSVFHAIKFNSGQTRKSKYSVYHEDYDGKFSINDIGLIKTRVPFHKDGSISPIKLPTNELVSNDLTEKYKYCYSAGWGVSGPNVQLIYDQKLKIWTYNKDFTRHDRRLSHIVLPIISNNQCKRIYYSNLGYRYDIEETHICTLYYPGRKSLCRGDSGAPLICGSVQYGVVSWSFACGAPRVGADVHTRVDLYLDWINNTITINEGNNLDEKENTKLIINNDYYDILSYANSSINTLFFKLLFNYFIIILIRLF